MNKHVRKKYIDHYQKELLKQAPEYKPGSFWQKALFDIAEEYVLSGVKNFRSIKKNLEFFVPTYGIPGNGFSDENVKILLEASRSFSKRQKMIIEDAISGYQLAFNDYRLFKALHGKSDNLQIIDFSESNIGKPKERFEFDGKAFSRSSLNYLLGLSLLKKLDPKFIPKTILEIGGGFGTLGEILSHSNVRDFKYISLDLPPMFLIAKEYLEKSFYKRNDFFNDFNNQTGSLLISNLPKYNFLPNWRIADLIGEIDLFVNFISFQEMEPYIVKNYIKKIQGLCPEYVLLRNIREGKQLSRDGKIGVQTQIKSDDYLSYFSKYSLVEKSVTVFGYKTFDNFHSEVMVLKRKYE